MKWFFFLLPLWIFPSFVYSAGLGNQFCLEMFPTIRYSNGTQYFPTDAEGKAQRFAYSKIQLLVTNKVTDSNGYQNFSFMGHAHNVVGDQLAGRALKSSATLTEVRCCDGKIIQPFET